MARARATTGPLQATRLLAIALAAFSLCAEVARYAHLALVPHTRCAEHGELVEGGGASASAAEAAPLELPAVSSAEAPGEAGDHGHDHCAIASSVSSRASAPPPSDTITPAAPAEPQGPVD